MFESFKETWQKIQQDPPGKRFRRQYRRRQAAREGIFKRALFIGSGVIIGTVGFVMLFTPGPGIFFIFLGWGFIAQESLYLAILLDKVEIKIRKWVDWGQEKWEDASDLSKILFVFPVVIIGLIILYLAYLTLMA